MGYVINAGRVFSWASTRVATLEAREVILGKIGQVASVPDSWVHWVRVQRKGHQGIGPFNEPPQQVVVITASVVDPRRFDVSIQLTRNRKGRLLIKILHSDSPSHIHFMNTETVGDYIVHRFAVPGSAFQRALLAASSGDLQSRIDKKGRWHFLRNNLIQPDAVQRGVA